MKTVLSIQSSVTMGAVGNTMAAAVFAASPHHLCRVDTVQLAAHPGHGFRAGGSIVDADFAALLGGLDRLGDGGAWRGIDAMMTGYIAGAGQIPHVAGALDKFAGSGGGKPVLVDPVLGDHGRLYVGEDVAAGIRDRLVPRAGIVTPNTFELGWLTGVDIAGPGDAETAAAGMLERHSGLEAVVVTGIVDGGAVSDILYDRSGAAVLGSAQPRPGALPGAGDLFAALLMRGVMDGMAASDAAAEASIRTAVILDRTGVLGQSEISLEAVGTAP